MRVRGLVVMLTLMVLASLIVAITPAWAAQGHTVSHEMLVAADDDADWRLDPADYNVFGEDGRVARGVIGKLLARVTAPFLVMIFEGLIVAAIALLLIKVTKVVFGKGSRDGLMGWLTDIGIAVGIGAVVITGTWTIVYNAIMDALTQLGR